jgi:2-methylisocitrate lyase-like PEP mutase family enzyme
MPDTSTNARTNDRAESAMRVQDRARKLADLHVKGSPLILCSAWDAGSAKAIVQAGAEAIATSSWAVAHAVGYEDGEKIPKTIVEEVAAGIVEAVEVPVTVDFEGGYSEDNDELTKNIVRLLHLGVVGINLKDRIVNGSGLYSANRQAARIAAARRAAKQRCVELFINARTDLFLKNTDNHADYVEEAVQRAKIYADAGASGFFIPGLRQEALIARICESVSLPVNVMYDESLSSVERLTRLGVSRISYGNSPYIRAMEAVRKHAEEIFRHNRPEAVNTNNPPTSIRIIPKPKSPDRTSFTEATRHSGDVRPRGRTHFQ